MTMEGPRARPLHMSASMPYQIPVAAHMPGQIERGGLRPGQKLPAERDLADEWGIADQTVRRAMRELRERGLVVSPVGKGTFVTSRSRLVADQKGPGRHSDQASLKIA